VFAGSPHEESRSPCPVVERPCRAVGALCPGARRDPPQLGAQPAVRRRDRTGVRGAGGPRRAARGAGFGRRVPALRDRQAGLPVRLHVPCGPLGRPRRPEDHLAATGHRAVRDAARGSELAPRPAAARVHRAARPAGLRCRPGRDAAPEHAAPGRRGAARTARGAARGGAGAARTAATRAATGTARAAARRDRAGLDLPGAAQRHALADREHRPPGHACGPLSCCATRTSGSRCPSTPG